MTKKTTVKLYADLAAIDAAIKSIKTRGTSLQRDMHRAACSVLNHFGQHKDTRVIDRLIEAMPEMSRKNALHQWFEAFTTVEFVKGKAKVKAGGKHRLGEAMEKPFWKFKGVEGDTYVPIDLAARIHSLIKAIETDATKAAAAGEKPRDLTEYKRKLIDMQEDLAGLNSI